MNKLAVVLVAHIEAALLRFLVAYAELDGVIWVQLLPVEIQDEGAEICAPVPLDRDDQDATG